MTITMMVTVFYILVSVVLTLSLLYFSIFYFFGNRKLYNATSLIPGPNTFPLIGCAFSLLDLMKKMVKIFDSYPSPMRFVLGYRVWIVAKDPEHIKIILHSSKILEKDDVYKFAKPWVGNGLMTANHKLWREHRKLIQPTFHNKILKTFIPIFHEKSLLLIKTISDRVDDPEFELHPYFSLEIFFSLYENTVGLSIETKRKEIVKYLETNKRIIQTFVERFKCAWLHSNKLFNLTQLAKDFYKNIKEIQDFTDNVIQERKRVLKVKNEESSPERPKSFLDLMLELANSENKFTDHDIREQVDTIVIAGHDTSARTLNFIFLMLASHPTIQDKAYEEIFSIYGSSDPEKDPIKYEDLNRLEYLERIIKETMRLFPAGPVIARKALENFTLDDYKIPKDCGVIIPIFNIHRDEKIWPESLKFDPDRFLPEEMIKRHACSFIPFSAGMRDCIGRTYALMSLKVFTANFLRKYIVIKDKISKIEDINLTVDPLLTTTEPITLRIEKRVK
ncbi:cytochrome P450 4C1-like isoform X2 [Leptopilina heterotoma]|uniref:cytochrome P450 4C1-like isoform X2 n=1 Tax=Leptopilina heterotoma TaxID=63436 RepID=UPI001CA94862|nr:cytochrome P450 4C1-like isoform X2 [Leptopilina heterotoma]